MVNINLLRKVNVFTEKLEEHEKHEEEAEEDEGKKKMHQAEKKRNQTPVQ